MATEKVISVDALSKDERALVVASLELKVSSVVRAFRAEANPEVREARVREKAALESLIHRFR